MIPGQAQQFFEAAAAQSGASAYEVERSLRYNSTDSAYLNRTPSSAGNRRTWTWSGWVKRYSTGIRQIFFSCWTGSTRLQFGYLEDDRFQMGTQFAYILKSNALFRDPAAWQHWVISVDTTLSSNRCKVYLNGSEITSWNTNLFDSTFAQNADTDINQAAVHYIGQLGTGTSYLNAGLADVHFIDGQALAASDFGEYDDNNVWQPKAYSGTYGTNGFHLDFSDNSSNAALGYDAAGSNDWTVNNLSVSDGTVATANGALPILNTTGDYGETVGTGTRTDSNSSNIVLALPMNGTNGGTTFTDQHATIKGSGSAKTVTVSNVTTSTAQSFFYGSSALFNSTSDKLTVPTGGSGGDIDFEGGSFTIECWCYANSINPSSAHLVSCWVDPSPLSFLLSMGGGGSQNKFTFGAAGGNATDSTGRSAGQWYHVAGVRDGNTLRLFVNGQQSATSACSGDVTDPPADVTIGQMSNNSSANWNGYISDVRIYKGVAKYTSNFNPPSRTVGSNCDSLIDTPTNYEADSGNNGGNYATLNPLAISPNITPTVSNGNLEIERTAISSQWTSCGSTLAVSGGKYYWELRLPIINGTIARWGVADADDYEFNRDTLATGLPWLGSAAGTSWSMDVGGNTYHNGSIVSSSYSSTVTTGDVIGVALDCDANTLTFYKNGTSLGVAHSNVTASRLVPAVSLHGATHNKIVLNFGQRPFAYTPPTNHLPLVTTSLSDPTIADGSTAMDAKLYTGNGSTQTISGLGFSPDLVWIKDRGSASYWHQLFDTVRGAGKRLASNETNAEVTNFANGYLSSFSSDGFTVGPGSSNSDDVNRNTAPYVVWAWDGGTSTVSNTDGSITSSVRANASAGFSIVSYTGNGTAGATIGHGLNGPIGFMVIKNRDSAYQWLAWHESFNGNNYIPLNTGDAVQTNSAIWNGTSPSSSVITLGTNVSVNENTSDHIGYVWSPVEGYSAFGSYTGNGSTDGPFVYTGFRPRWVMIKWTTGSNAWIIVDTARDPFNPEKQNLNANDSNAENTSAAGSWFDGLSNGFKITGVTDNVINSSGGTYIYAAFAEHPFKTARAR